MSRSRRRRPGGRADARTTAPVRPNGVVPVPELLEPAPPVRPTAIPDAVVRSLGPPALPGLEVPATHTFAAVYERAVGLATALASAAGLLTEVPEDEGDPEPDEPLDADEPAPGDSDGAEPVTEDAAHDCEPSPDSF